MILRLNFNELFDSLSKDSLKAFDTNKNGLQSIDHQGLTNQISQGEYHVNSFHLSVNR